MIGVGYAYDLAHVAKLDFDIGIMAIIDVYNSDPIYAKISTPFGDIEIKVGFICPAYYYLVGGLGGGLSEVPDLQLKASIGEIPIVIGGGVIRADLSDPKNYNGLALQIGPISTGGSDLTLNPDLGVGIWGASYIGTGSYVYYTPGMGILVPPKSWVEDVLELLPTTPMGTATSYAGGGGGGGHYHYC